MPRKVWLGAAVVGAAALAFGSVQSTGALWRDQAELAGTNVRTGTISLAAGDPATAESDYLFGALSKDPVALNESVQAPLVFTNTGNTALRFRLSAAGPAVSTTGAAATVTLAGAVLPPVGGSCTSSTAMGSAFAMISTSSPATAVPPVWQSLAKGASQTWCVRTVLTTVTSTSAVAYTHRFTFAVEQTR